MKRHFLKCVDISRHLIQFMASKKAKFPVKLIKLIILDRFWSKNINEVKPFCDLQISLHEWLQIVSCVFVTLLSHMWGLSILIVNVAAADNHYCCWLYLLLLRLPRSDDYIPNDIFFLCVCKKKAYNNEIQFALSINNRKLSHHHCWKHKNREKKQSHTHLRQIFVH